jgi:hypothetical protein
VDNHGWGRLTMKKNNVLPTLIAVFVIMLLGIDAAEAQDVPDASKFVTFSLENDSIGSGRDENYTNGVRFTAFDTQARAPEFIDRIAGKIPTFDINQTTSIYYTLGQNLYTPSDITLPYAQPNDRPWAAWLYMSAGLVTVTGNHADDVELTAGVVGPAAAGEPVQLTVHRITNSKTPKGWNNQIHSEPGLMVSWNRRFPDALETNFLGFHAALTPHGGATLGNIYTYGNAGATVYLTPSDDGIQDVPPRVRPAMPGTGFFATPESGVSWYLFAGVEGRAVARNIFLDGNTFRDSPSVDKENFVADGNAGLAVTWDDFRLSYSLTYRTREFETQDHDSVFGGLSIGYRY